MCRRYVIPAVLLILALPLQAQAVREHLLMSADSLQRQLSKVTVLYIGNPASYDAGHIPGAVLIEPSSLVVERDGTPNELPPIEALERTFRAAGVGSSGRIVIYSDDIVLASRAWFTLDYLGQGERTALLNGGYRKWTDAGFQGSTGRTRPSAGSFVAQVAPEKVVRMAAMRELIRLRDQRGSTIALIDARSVDQFCGENPGPDVSRGGHIPGAVNVPYASNLNADGTFRSVYDLRMLYGQAGVTRDSANVVYCRTGMQASVAYFVLRYLGYDTTLYDGSYIEWSNAGELTWT